MSKRSTGPSRRDRVSIDAQLADACWRAQMVEEKAAAAASAARSEAVEAHKVLRKAVAAHAAEVAAEMTEKKKQRATEWVANMQAKMDVVLARHIQRMEDELAAELK